jgi:RNA polymerase sigma-70 factor (ECF subfamily)
MQLQIPQPAKTRRWLLTILHNLWIDHMRKNARDPSPVAEVLDTSAPDPAPEPVWSSLTIEDVRDALSTIAPDLREVYTLHVFERRPYDEIANLLSISRMTVGTRLHRARRQLREILTKRIREAT